MTDYADIKYVSSGTTAYANLAAFPSSGNSTGDLGFAEDTDALYIWDGAAWTRIDNGDESPVILTEPSPTHTLASDGSTSTVTMTAQDPEGFDITYGIAYKTTDNALPDQLASATSINQSTGVYTFTPTTTTSNGGTFRARLSASDGAKTTTRFVDFSLSFTADIEFGSGSQVSVFAATINNTTYTTSRLSDSPLKSGKYYIECKVLSYTGGVPFLTGIVDSNNLSVDFYSAYNVSYYYNGNIYHSGTTTAQGSGTIVANDIIGVCYDTSTREVWIANNNVWYEDPATESSSFVLSGTGDFYYGFLCGNTASSSISIKFHVGENAGDRVYDAPSGFSNY